jgi:MFS family permease
VFRTPLIRSTMLLDFFATFFASATALLPIFAQDILRVGAQGYGVLSAAPSVGALVASAAMVPLAERMDHRGRVMLWSVVGYGVATVVFGISQRFWLTFVCLALTGATDTVSMVIRNIIRQFHTPDAMRGRMTSVNMIFFMGGPQLGELEAGVVAGAFGAPAGRDGGIACVLATAWVAWRTPRCADTVARCRSRRPSAIRVASVEVPPSDRVNRRDVARHDAPALRERRRSHFALSKTDALVTIVVPYLMVAS